MEAYAASLGVSVDAVRCAVPTTQLCRKDGCSIVALGGNFGLCGECRPSWFPLKTPAASSSSSSSSSSTSSSSSEPQRGWMLLGPEFMRASVKSGTTCDCGSRQCVGIGYGDLFAFPTIEAHRQAWFTAANIKGPDGRQLSTKDTTSNYNQNPTHHSMAYWHFPTELREFKGGKWRLRDRHKAYTDSDGKKWPCAVPILSTSSFIDNEVRGCKTHPSKRWAIETEPRPSWAPPVPVEAWTVVDDGEGGGPDSSTEHATSSRKRKRSLPEKRAEQQHLRAEAAEDRVTVLEEQMRVMKESNRMTVAALEEKVTLLTEQNEVLKCEKAVLSKQVVEAKAALNGLQSGLGRHLKYSDLHTGVLQKHVAAFTYFPTARLNDLFLEAVNLKHDDDDLGICTRLLRHRAFSKALREGKKAPGAAGGRPRKLDYKTEYLVYSIYVHGGWTESMLSALFGVDESVVCDIVTTWANYLDRFFARAFPTPTRSQVLRAYPARVLASFGHARIFMHLDATEVKAEVPKYKDAHSAMHSNYKGCSTIKFLAGCDPIGTVWYDSVSVGYPGSISDPVQTAESKILSFLPAGVSVCVDKGFLIENLAAELGLQAIRPVKKRKLQKQQSAAETATTQKVGNSRIVIEQVNGQMKMQDRYFNGKVPILQTSIVSLLFKNGFMMTNFKVGFVIGNHTGAARGRECRAAVRYTGKSDDGLIDVRGMPETWATKSEMKRFKKAMEIFPSMPPADVGELVLSGNDQIAKAAYARSLLRAVF